MKFLGFCILFCIIPQVLFLKCYNYDPKYSNQTKIDDCGAETPTCSLEVAYQNCIKTVEHYCLTYSFCNDRDNCNVDNSDTTIDTTVKSRKCQCHHVSDPPHKQMNQRSREGDRDCEIGSDQIECNATALINETAFCVHMTYQRENLTRTINQGCASQPVNNGPIYRSRLDYSCNTDLCNVPADHCGPLCNYSTTSSLATPKSPTTSGPPTRPSSSQSNLSSTYLTTTNTGSVATTVQTARSQTPTSATTGPSTKSSTLQSYVSSTSTYPTPTNTRSVARTDETNRPQTPTSASNRPHYAVLVTFSAAIRIAKVLG